MVFVHDTRDKPGKHENVENYFKSKGQRFVRSKLFVGDVAILQPISIDLKRDLNEVCLNLGKGHERFREECINAHENDVHLIILVEHGGKIKSIEDVKNWENPRLAKSPYAISGERLYRLMRTYQEKYGVEWRFCDKRSTGRVITEILGGVNGNE